jgi:hypothetical protein
MSRSMFALLVLTLGAVIAFGSAHLLFAADGCGDARVSLLTFHSHLRMVHLARADCTVRLLAWNEALDVQTQPEISGAGEGSRLEVDEGIVTVRLQPATSKITSFGLSIGGATGTVVIERGPQG